jgi:hypothetical protein
MTDHPIDDLQSFVLGDLDRPAADAVLAHADTCPDCSAIIADAMIGMSALAAAEGERKPVPIRRTTRHARTAWLAGLATAATLAMGVWNVELQTTRSAVPVDALVHSHFTHHPLTGASGDAKLIQAVDGSWVYLVADGLRPLERYELSVNGKLVGDLRADAGGQATAFWRRAPGTIAAASLASADGLSLRWREK